MIPVKIDVGGWDNAKHDCIVCLRKFDYNENKKTYPQQSEKVCKIFKACSSYLKPEVFTNSSNWDCVKISEKTSPFCRSCFISGEKLSCMDERLNDIQSKIGTFVDKFSKEILRYRKEEQISIDLEVTTRIKTEPNSLLVKEENDWDAELAYETVDNFVPSPESHSLSPENSGESNDVLEGKYNSPKTESVLENDGHQVNICGRRTTRMQLRKLSIPVERLQYFHSETRNKSRQVSNKLKAIKGDLPLIDSDSGSAFENSDGESDSNEESSWSDSDSMPKYSPKRKNANSKQKIQSINGTSSRDSISQSFKCEKCDFSTNRKDTLRFHVLHKHTEIIDTFDCEFCSLKMKSEKAYKQHQKQHSKSFACDECGKLFNKRNRINQYDYEIHCLEHKFEIPFECQICHEKFSNVNNYCNHQKFSTCGKSNNETFNCEFCHERFYFKYLLLLHYLDHSRRGKGLGKNIECKICGKVYKNDKHKYGRLEPHYLQHTQENSLSCDVCGMPVGEKTILNQHRQTHKANYKDLEIPCDKCGRMFTSKKNLNSHMEIKHNTSNESFTCETCGKDFRVKKLYKRHIKEHSREFTCEQCGQKFDEEGPKNQFDYEIHYLTHRNEIPYDCQFCHEKFSNVINYCKHQKFSSCGKSEMQLLTCELCEKKFYFKYLLLLHQIDHMPVKRGIGTIDCKICGKQFVNNKDRFNKLESHYQFHTKEFSLNCDICFMPMRDKHTLNQHRQTHKPDFTEPEFPCQHCSKIFTSQKNLNSHVEIKHTESTESFTCEVCQKVFKIKKMFRQHVKTHSTNLPCEICGKTFNAVGALNMHMRMHTGAFTCKECGLKCKTENSLKIHTSVVHRKEKRFICELCGQGYYYLHDYNLHMKRHSEHHSFNCEFCGGKFTREYDFKIHMKIHTGKGLDSSECPFICDVCGKLFKYQQSLKQHHDAHHSGVSVEFKCDQCDKIFNRKDSLLGHVKRTHEEREDLNLPCEMCGGKYKNERALKQHMKQHTVAIPCGICEKTFHTPAQVKVHRRQHTGELFPCDKCDKQFSSAACLKSHVSAVHLKIIRHFCEVCGKGFYKRTGYLGHLETHSDEKTCQCKECGEWFNTRHKLSDHRRKMHTGESFECQPCGKTFLRKATLKLHIKKRHNKASIAVPSGKQSKRRTKSTDSIQIPNSQPIDQDRSTITSTPSHTPQNQPTPAIVYHSHLQHPVNFSSNHEGMWLLK